MAAFQPNKKAFGVDERILNDRLYLDERPVLINFLTRLRAAQTSSDYFHLQLDLFRRVKARQDQIDRLKGVLKEQQKRLSALARAEPRDTAALSQGQGAARSVSTRSRSTVRCRASCQGSRTESLGARSTTTVRRTDPRDTSVTSTSSAARSPPGCAGKHRRHAGRTRRVRWGEAALGRSGQKAAEAEAAATAGCSTRPATRT
jgi:hypothetical protein